jgi:hypothetical protein
MAERDSTYRLPINSTVLTIVLLLVSFAGGYAAKSAELSLSDKQQTVAIEKLEAGKVDKAQFDEFSRRMDQGMQNIQGEAQALRAEIQGLRAELARKR